uniref:Reverse transcriptase domain-containing protein n=1 Tax=Oreochromis niloticus TaxID=8128 RepID=A0A669CC42_ORENI
MYHLPAPILLKPVIFERFSPVSLPELLKLVTSMRSSACPLDILSGSLFKNVFKSIGPSVLTIINASLLSGQVPVYCKSAVIHQLLKKPKLDPSLLSSYRPISKLPFIAKILEKVVAKQLTVVLDEHNVLDKFQSGFRKAHSTETALLRVSNDILMNYDAGECTVLMLLDLTSAFDTVDHLILLDRLNHWVGVSGTALEWFKSYLSNRSFSVATSKFRSSVSCLAYRVPQGSVLGPLLFLLYLLPLLQLLSSFTDISYHCYADDIRLYISFRPPDVSKLQILQSCLDSIRDWMAGNYLQLNADKTEVIVFAPEKFVPLVVKNLGPLASYIKSSIRNLGVTFDPALTLDTHVKSLVRFCFYHLRNIAKSHCVTFRFGNDYSCFCFIPLRLL